MHSTTPGTSTPTRVTSHLPFFGCNASRDCLFSVQPGLPLNDALETASCLLESARGAIIAREELESANAAGTSPNAIPDDRSAIHGAAYLVEMTKGIIDSLKAGTPTPSVVTSSTTLSSVVTFLEARLADSRQQAGKEAGGAGKALYQGRVSAFELALEMLREVAQ